MEFRQPSAGRPQAEPAVNNYAGEPSNNPFGGILGKILTVALILAAVTFVGIYAAQAVSAVASGSTVKSKQYQAVFLTNGQVYFGKVSKVDSSYVKLTDIYYLQVTSNASGSQSVQPKASDAASQQQVSLAKLGGELHGPEDAMFISRDQVLFWENLTNDGKVAKAIADYTKSGNK